MSRLSKITAGIRVSVRIGVSIVSVIGRGIELPHVE